MPLSDTTLKIIDNTEKFKSNEWLLSDDQGGNNTGA